MTSAGDAIEFIEGWLIANTTIGRARATAEELVNALAKAPDSVKQEFVALLDPWRPIETAPKKNHEPIILYWKGRRPMEGFWYDIDTLEAPYTSSRGAGWYASGPITPFYEPSGWLPLRAPPSEDEA